MGERTKYLERADFLVTQKKNKIEIELYILLFISQEFCSPS